MVNVFLIAVPASISNVSCFKRRQHASVLTPIDQLIALSLVFGSDSFGSRQQAGAAYIRVPYRPRQGRDQQTIAEL